MPGDAVELRPYAASDLDWLSGASAQVGGLRVVSRGVLHALPELPGHVAWRGAQRVGFVFHHLDGGECELVAIGAESRRGGVDRARRLEPQISQVGEFGIPIRHELGLEKVL